MANPFRCPICQTDADQGPPPQGDYLDVDCPRCGNYRISGTTLTIIRSNPPNEPDWLRDALSHLVRRLAAANSQTRPFVSSEVWMRLQSSARLVSPDEQANNLIIWLGTHVDDPGTWTPIASGTLASIMGARNSYGSMKYVLKEMQGHGWVDLSHPNSTSGEPLYERLTFRGWQRFEELRRTVSDSHRAFMAMQFGNADLDRAYRDCFQPAVTSAGFRLYRLDEGQGAGLIDDQLRVSIRTSRFLLADLTTHNNGAYWEAGFAEGLGKPVIYLCSKQTWDERRTHFDTNHLVTVIWSLDDLDDARRRLAATIRATFPADAKMEDGS